MLLLSLPLIASRLLISLENVVPRDVAGDPPQAIVVLSGKTEPVLGPGLDRVVVLSLSSGRPRRPCWPGAPGCRCWAPAGCCGTTTFR